jgi:hypothetical protein
MLTRTPWCWCYACWRRRRRRACFTLAVLGIAAAVLASEHARLDHAQPAPARTKTAPAPSQLARRPATELPGTSLVSAGQGLNWKDFYGIELPVSASDGPRHTRRGLASGFADTPRGALLAAMNIAVRTAAQWGTAIFRPTIIRQVTGPDAGLLLQADAAAYTQLRAAAHVRPGQPAGRGNATAAGYRFLAYTPADATVDIVTAGPGTDGTAVLASTRIQVIWQRGDWRVVAPAGGDWASAATAMSSLTGYTLFPGR